MAWSCALPRPRSRSRSRPRHSLPLPGAEISAVKHIIDGDVGSMEIRFAHSDGGTLDTAELNTGFWDGATVQMYLVDRSDAADARRSDLHRPDRHGDRSIRSGRPARSIFAALPRRPRRSSRRYQPMCRTDLFSSLCQLNEADWDHAGTVGTILDRFNFTVAGLGAPPADGWFNQGTFVTASGFKGVIANWILSSLKITTYQPQCMARLTAGEAHYALSGLRQDRHDLPRTSSTTRSTSRVRIIFSASIPSWVCDRWRSIFDNLR